MAEQMTKENFIQNVLIGEIAKIKDKHPFFAFTLMACGIEFLGRILKKRKENDVNYSRFDFNYAVFNLTVLEKYRPYASEPKGEDPSDGYINPTSPLNKNDCKDDLYSKLRCCLAHQFLMGENLNLSDSNENKLDVPPITLGVHAFYNDFEKACKEVLTKLSTEKELSELQQITHMVIEKTENGSSVSGHP